MEDSFNSWKWGWFLLPLLVLVLGGDIARNVREMPSTGWIILMITEALIYAILYWRYKKIKSQKK